MLMLISSMFHLFILFVLLLTRFSDRMLESPKKQKVTPQHKGIAANKIQKEVEVVAALWVNNIVFKQYYILTCLLFYSEKLPKKSVKSKTEDVFKYVFVFAVVIVL